MDRKMTIEKLKEAIKKFCEKRDWDKFHNAKDLAINIINEASELLEFFRFKSNEEVNKMFKSNKKKRQIACEVADLFFALLRLCQRYNIDISDSLLSKINTLNRKYPVSKAKGSNKKYNEL
ncbi:MAG: nucleotide pyrophosphohydrolase [Planctomycetota bacterium]